MWHVLVGQLFVRMRIENRTPFYFLMNPDLVSEVIVLNVENTEIHSFISERVSNGCTDLYVRQRAMNGLIILILKSSTTLLQIFLPLGLFLLMIIFDLSAQQKCLMP